MRADAQHNRQRLLDAAEDLFAQKGTSVSVADIVAAAGVGAPTLYRHFGTKDGLIRAIGEQRAEVAAAHLARALAQPTGWQGLKIAIDVSLEMARTNRAIREQRGVAIVPALERMLLAGWGELVERGQREGSVRADLAATDVPYVLTALTALGRAVDFRPDLQSRYVALLMDGLRPGTATPLPGRPPTPRDVRDSFAPRS